MYQLSASIDQSLIIYFLCKVDFTLCLRVAAIKKASTIILQFFFKCF